MDSAIPVDSNLRLQISIWSRTVTSVNVAYRERVNGSVKQARQTTINEGRIASYSSGNFFYFTFSGNKDQYSELLNVAVSLTAANVQWGEVFVRAAITVGGTDQNDSAPIVILFSDYITSSSFLGYPGSRVASSLEGRGYISSVICGNNAGVATFTADEYSIVKILSIFGVIINDDPTDPVSIQPAITKDSGQGDYIFWIKTTAESINAGQNLKFSLSPGNTYSKYYSDGFYSMCDYLGENIYLTNDAIYCIDYSGSGGTLDTSMIVKCETWIKA
jgi:hypothetical protein